MYKFLKNSNQIFYEANNTEGQFTNQHLETSETPQILLIKKVSKQTEFQVISCVMFMYMSMTIIIFYILTLYKNKLSGNITNNKDIKNIKK